MRLCTCAVAAATTRRHALAHFYQSDATFLPYHLVPGKSGLSRDVRRRLSKHMGTFEFQVKAEDVAGKVRAGNVAPIRVYNAFQIFL